MDERQIQVLLADMCARKSEGVVVPFVDVSTATWAPEAKQCHRNVDQWVVDHPECKAVRGWLVFDINQTSMGLLPIIRFEAHSIVENADGSRIDITPTVAPQRYPFLEHAGPEDEFASIIEAGFFSLTASPHHKP